MTQWFSANQPKVQRDLQKMPGKALQFKSNEAVLASIRKKLKIQAWFSTFRPVQLTWLKVCTSSSRPLILVSKGHPRIEMPPIICQHLKVQEGSLKEDEVHLLVKIINNRAKNSYKIRRNSSNIRQQVYFIELMRWLLNKNILYKKRRNEIFKTIIALFFSIDQFYSEVDKCFILYCNLLHF